MDHDNWNAIREENQIIAEAMGEYLSTLNTVWELIDSSSNQIERSRMLLSNYHKMNELARKADAQLAKARESLMLKLCSPSALQELVSLKLLIVDDEPELLESLCRFVKLSGHSCATALNVSQAIESLARELPEIVITNYRLPDGDALDVISRVRQLSPKIPVIVITGYHEPGMEEAAREAGASAYLRKPFPLEALTEAIAEVKKIRERMSLSL